MGDCLWGFSFLWGRVVRGEGFWGELLWGMIWDGGSRIVIVCFVVVDGVYGVKGLWRGVGFGCFVWEGKEEGVGFCLEGVMCSLDV